jgi:hypothetical protein
MRTRSPNPHHRLQEPSDPADVTIWHIAQPTESSHVMTDQNPHTHATQPAAGPDTVTVACVHIDASARQLEAAARGDVFSTLLSLAGQLALIRGGIDPTIRAAPDPNDHLGPVAHVDRALLLLDSVPVSVGPADLLVWTLHLSDLRDCGAGRP